MRGAFVEEKDTKDDASLVNHHNHSLVGELPDHTGTKNSRLRQRLVRRRPTSMRRMRLPADSDTSGRLSSFSTYYGRRRKSIDPKEAREF
eukprot:CAMPEP_0194346758 /NCGR_PEP_ID=MMETSP0171-20130528/105603_1 /TAXON_ID=218684 /ORGANISM="Corethron pennatum, Strain L29A3" /LENGTH=89 /DNA_ID=CAMNT_0039113921 /DNA_START=1875 /DNA_END=2147 /DNA_ORIENTATION=-